MKHYLCLDCGTTNTRIHYTENNAIRKTVHFQTGIRDAIGNKDALISVLSDGIQNLQEQYGKPDAILASGMITSEQGLYTLPHLPLPAGIADLHRGMKEVLLPAVSDLPICLIPGVRNFTEDFTQCDMMRGEESEVFGLLEDGDCLFVLPGSHCKHIRVTNGKITSFQTFLTGELIAALAGNTILKASLALEQGYDEDALLAGCRFALENGLSSALFKVRIYGALYGADAKQCNGFFLGAVLSEEIGQLLRENEAPIVIAGQKALAGATAALLRRLGKDSVRLKDEARCAGANVRGMIRIFENR